MNYYEEIKNKLINNGHTKRVKDYSKNKSDLDSYYFVDKMLNFYVLIEKVQTVSAQLTYSY